MNEQRRLFFLVADPNNANQAVVHVCVHGEDPNGAVEEILILHEVLYIQTAKNATSGQSTALMLDTKPSAGQVVDRTMRLVAS